MSIDNEETVKCECGSNVPLSQARMDDDACWYCPRCMEEIEKESKSLNTYNVSYIIGTKVECSEHHGYNIFHAADNFMQENVYDEITAIEKIEK